MYCWQKTVSIISLDLGLWWWQLSRLCRLVCSDMYSLVEVYWYSRGAYWFCCHHDVSQVFTASIITLMMEAVNISETLVNFYQGIQHCNPEDRNLQHTLFCLHCDLSHRNILICWMPLILLLTYNIYMFIYFLIMDLLYHPCVHPPKLSFILFCVLHNI